MQRFRIGAITDEFSPDIEVASQSMESLGMQAAELRMVFGKNIIDLSNPELDRASEIVARHGLGQRLLYRFIETLSFDPSKCRGIRSEVVWKAHRDVFRHGVMIPSHFLIASRPRCGSAARIGDTFGHAA